MASLWKQFDDHVKGKEDLDLDSEDPPLSDAGQVDEAVSCAIKSPIAEQHSAQFSNNVLLLLRRRLTPQQLQHVDRIKIDFYTQYRFPGARSLPTIRTASAASGARSRPADALLLDTSHVALCNDHLCWADLATVVQATVPGTASSPSTRFVLLAVRPYLQCSHLQRNNIIDQCTGMPLVKRSPPTDSPIIIWPSAVVAPVHVINFPTALDYEVDTTSLCFINWWIFRSEWKYPVRLRDSLVGLRGHGVPAARKAKSAAVSSSQVVK